MLDKVKWKAKLRNRYNHVPHLTKNELSDKKKLANITHKRDKRLALSLQVVTRLQGTDKTPMSKRKTMYFTQQCNRSTV